MLKGSHDKKKKIIIITTLLRNTFLFISKFVDFFSLCYQKQKNLLSSIHLLLRLLPPNRWFWLLYKINFIEADYNVPNTDVSIRWQIWSKEQVMNFSKLYKNKSFSSKCLGEGVEERDKEKNIALSTCKRMKWILIL